MKWDLVFLLEELQQASHTYIILNSYPSSRAKFVLPPQLQNEVGIHPLSPCIPVSFAGGQETLVGQRPQLPALFLWWEGLGGLAGQVSSCFPEADRLCHCSPAVPEDFQLSSCIPSRTREMLWSRVSCRGAEHVLAWAWQRGRQVSVILRCSGSLGGPAELFQR